MCRKTVTNQCVVVHVGPGHDTVDLPPVGLIGTMFLQSLHTYALRPSMTRKWKCHRLGHAHYILQLKSLNYGQFSMSITRYRVNPVISCLSFKLYSFYCVHNSMTSTVLAMSPLFFLWYALLHGTSTRIGSCLHGLTIRASF